eukprot:jgi/Astpho2/2594/fgenesh1_pg.00048_%23_85_t
MSLGPISASPQYVVEAFLKLAEVTSSDTLIDVGCNDGRFLIGAAKQCGAKGIGIELDVAAAAKAKRLVQAEGLEALITIKQCDALGMNLGSATIVYLYLLPKAMQQLSDKLQADLQPGTRVVTYMFR